MNINIITLKEIVKNYIMIGSGEYNVELGEYNLKYDKQNNIFNFVYVLKINNTEVSNRLTLFKGDIINILNYFFKVSNQEVKDYNILNPEDDLLNISINLEIIKNKQKIKRNNYEI